MSTTEAREPEDILSKAAHDAHLFQDNRDETRSRDSTSPYNSVLEAENRTLAERKLVRKLDSRLLPTIVLIYVMNFIDVCYT